MRVVFERSVRGAPDYELVWLLVLAAAALMAGAWLLLPVVHPPCVFRTITGIPCPSCGGTRCLRSLLSGHFWVAWSWNPLVFLSAFAAGVYGLYALVVTMLRLPRLRVHSLSRRESNVLRVVIALVFASNWIYLIHHFSQLSPDPIRKHGLTASWPAQ